LLFKKNDHVNPGNPVNLVRLAVGTTIISTALSQVGWAKACPAESARERQSIPRRAQHPRRSFPVMDRWAGCAFSSFRVGLRNPVARDGKQAYPINTRSSAAVPRRTSLPSLAPRSRRPSRDDGFSSPGLWPQAPAWERVLTLQSGRLGKGALCRVGERATVYPAPCPTLCL